MKYMVHCDYLDEDNSVNEDWSECETEQEAEAIMQEMKVFGAWGILYQELN